MQARRFPDACSGEAALQDRRGRRQPSGTSTVTPGGVVLIASSASDVNPSQQATVNVASLFVESARPRSSRNHPHLCNSTVKFQLILTTIVCRASPVRPDMRKESVAHTGAERSVSLAGDNGSEVEVNGQPRKLCNTSARRRSRGGHLTAATQRPRSTADGLQRRAFGGMLIPPRLMLRPCWATIER